MNCNQLINLNEEPTPKGAGWIIVWVRGKRGGGEGERGGMGKHLLTFSLEPVPLNLSPLTFPRLSTN